MAQGLSLTPVEKTNAGTGRSLLTWQSVNVHPAESALSVLGGGALLVFGLRRRGGWGITAGLLGGELLRRGLTRHSFLYQGLHIATAKRTSEQESAEVTSCKSEREVTINRSPQEVYRYWRDLERLPALLPSLKEVRVQGATTSHWAIYAPGGFSLTWEAEITREEPGELIRWRTLPGSTVLHRGIIQFTPAPGGRGTEVKVVLEYTPPGGRVADLLTRALRISPDQRLQESLRRFKAIMETGEAPRV